MEWTNTPEYLTMYHDLPQAANFWSFLFAVDQDLAETVARMAVRAVDACIAPTTPVSHAASLSSWLKNSASG